MKTLITGANGFLGSALVGRLQERGHTDLRGLVRPWSDRSRLAPYVERGLEIFGGTLNRPQDCARMLEGVDRVFHLAAATSGTPADMFLNSVVATSRLLDAVVAADRPIELIFCSSFSVYGVAELSSGAVLDEAVAVEPHPNRRDMYSHTKLRQEQLVWEYHRKHNLPTVVLRPGIIYGPGAGAAVSSSVGLNLFGLFLHLGGRNPLPLTYIDNCADAFAVVADHAGRNGGVYNVVDDDLISAAAFLQRYRAEVNKQPSITVPYPLTWLGSYVLEKYCAATGNQLPPIFTRYKTSSLWRPLQYRNDKLKQAGWTQQVSTATGLTRHFDHFREQRAASH